jgi:hypothetical protein
MNLQQYRALIANVKLYDKINMIRYIYKNGCSAGERYSHSQYLAIYEEAISQL